MTFSSHWCGTCRQGNTICCGLAFATFWMQVELGVIRLKLVCSIGTGSRLRRWRAPSLWRRASLAWSKPSLHQRLTLFASKSTHTTQSSTPLICFRSNGLCSSVLSWFFFATISRIFDSKASMTAYTSNINQHIASFLPQTCSITSSACSTPTAQRCCTEIMSFLICLHWIPSTALLASSSFEWNTSFQTSFLIISFCIFLQLSIATFIVFQTCWWLTSIKASTIICSLKHISFIEYASSFSKGLDIVYYNCIINLWWHSISHMVWVI